MNIWNYDHPLLTWHVAADEALLIWAEQTQSPAVMRVWESTQPGIVLGCGNAIRSEVNLDRAVALGLPIVRRCSGGGTVYLGPGCLNYALVLPIDFVPSLVSINGTTNWVMAHIRDAIRSVSAVFNPSFLGSGVPLDIQVRGTSDLVINQVKFSGNAQRRRKTHVLFHGTVLCQMDLNALNAVLAHPSREPDYRQGRSHLDFVCNLGISTEIIRNALMTYFKVSGAISGPRVQDVQSLVDEKYGRLEWNARV